MNEHLLVAASNIGGVPVHAVNLNQAADLMRSWVHQRLRTYVCFCNIHSVVCSFRNESVRRAYLQAGLNAPSGMPLVWILRSRGFHHVSRVYGPGAMLALCAILQGDAPKHFFYGGAPGVADRLVERLKARYPRLRTGGTLSGLRPSGTRSPPFRPLSEAEERDVIFRINESEAEIVWVGLGGPKQELWMAQYRSRLSAPLLLGVGYAFDALAGVKPQAPVWMQRAGLEWAFRFAQEPARLWPRILVDAPLFLTALALQALRGRRFPPTS